MYILVSVISAFLIPFFIVGGSGSEVNVEVEPTPNAISLGDCELGVEEARTKEERNLGLMYRESLKDDTGMLFYLDKPITPDSGYGFWMPNMNFSLDMVFLNEDFEVVDVLDNVPPCETEDCPTYRPKKAADYVLEINANKAAECNVAEGSRLMFIKKIIPLD